MRIAQRLRLEASQLEGVARRMTVRLRAQVSHCPTHRKGGHGWAPLSPWLVLGWCDGILGVDDEGRVLLSTRGVKFL